MHYLDHYQNMFFLSVLYVNFRWSLLLGASAKGGETAPQAVAGSTTNCKEYHELRGSSDQSILGRPERMKNHDTSRDSQTTTRLDGEKETSTRSTALSVRCLRLESLSLKTMEISQATSVKKLPLASPVKPLRRPIEMA